MENTELELFNQIFNHEIKDDVMKFIPPTYETWINFKNQHTFYRGLIKPDKISPIDSWLDDRHINCDYKNYILKKDINFFKVFLTNNNILFDKARAIIILCLSIIDTEIFSPPIYYDNIISKTGDRNIHPGKTLATACNIIKKDLPVLSITKKDEKKPIIAQEKIISLNEIKNMYKGKLFGSFFEHNGRTVLQFFSMYNEYQKFDNKGWLAYPEINWGKFWNHVQTCTEGHGEKIKFNFNNINVTMNLNNNSIKNIFQGGLPCYKLMK